MGITIDDVRDVIVPPFVAYEWGNGRIFIRADHVSGAPLISLVGDDETKEELLARMPELVKMYRDGPPPPPPHLKAAWR